MPTLHTKISTAPVEKYSLIVSINFITLDRIKLIEYLDIYFIDTNYYLKHLLDILSNMLALQTKDVYRYFHSMLKSDVLRAAQHK